MQGYCRELDVSTFHEKFGPSVAWSASRCLILTRVEQECVLLVLLVCLLDDSVVAETHTPRVRTLP